MMKIKMLVMDVDGTLTDGKIYFGANGEMMKAFDVRDGYGIIHLDKHGITPVIITGKSSDIVKNRAAELKIREVHQGIADKQACLTQITEKYGVNFNEIAYIGDDVNDLDCMRLCGISACPRDALEEVTTEVDYVCSHDGGHGAVREFIGYLIKLNSTI